MLYLATHGDAVLVIAVPVRLELLGVADENLKYLSLNRDRALIAGRLALDLGKNLIRKPDGLEIVVVRNTIPVSRAELALIVADLEALRDVTVIANLGARIHELIRVGIPEHDARVTVIFTVNTDNIAILQLDLVELKNLRDPHLLIRLAHLIQRRRRVILDVFHNLRILQRLVSRRPEATRIVLLVLRNSLIRDDIVNRLHTILPNALLVQNRDNLCAHCCCCCCCI